MSRVGPWDHKVSIPGAVSLVLVNFRCFSPTILSVSVQDFLRSESARFSDLASAEVLAKRIAVSGNEVELKLAAAYAHTILVHSTILRFQSRFNPGRFRAQVLRHFAKYSMRKKIKEKTLHDRRINKGKTNFNSMVSFRSREC